MILETVTVSQRARDHLIALKRHTKIENWNVLCRWALMASLKNPDRPSKEVTTPESNIEMTWRTFAGANDEVISALVKQRCAIDLNLFNKDGVFLGGSEYHRPIGEWWEKQHADACWGGRFEDGNHYSLTHEGIK